MKSRGRLYAKSLFQFVGIGEIRVKDPAGPETGAPRAGDEHKKGTDPGGSVPWK
jgi:hypothetical protein